MAFPARVSSVAVSQINVTPLVDVLLVLLIIFMISAPVVTHKLKIDLPRPIPDETQQKAEPIQLAIHADGSMYWNDMPVDQIAINAQLAIAGLQKIQPALYIDVADGASYQVVAHVLSSAKSNGMASINFIDQR
ncbi:biopolymer transporter ExbD [Rhodanobacter glycinis]|uniref:Biopolymer transporter ExbD n=1 Tax=Rhodanobacter glycinis TaxID=582702 RepID=A0A502C6D7_9GAMM|nr:biopolymer transporter ExbD [Rhodanobacter glycinis]TPG08214.1 biopolymer transporter ExbD [Rhodanobacter glycinis]